MRYIIAQAKETRGSRTLRDFISTIPGITEVGNSINPDRLTVTMEPSFVSVLQSLSSMRIIVEQEIEHTYEQQS